MDIDIIQLYYEWPQIKHLKDATILQGYNGNPRHVTRQLPLVFEPSQQMI